MHVSPVGGRSRCRDAVEPCRSWRPPEGTDVTEQSADPRDVALGAAFAGIRAGAAAGRVALLPGRVAVRAPVVGHSLRRAGDDLAADGRRAQVWARARLEQASGAVLA